MKPKERLAILKDLDRGINEPFKSQDDCINWANKVAPFLQFNPQHCETFMHHANIRSKKERWYAKPSGILILGIIASLIAALIWWKFTPLIEKTITGGESYCEVSAFVNFHTGETEFVPSHVGDKPLKDISIHVTDRVAEGKYYNSIPKIYLSKPMTKDSWLNYLETENLLRREYKKLKFKQEFYIPSLLLGGTDKPLFVVDPDSLDQVYDYLIVVEWGENKIEQVIRIQHVDGYWQSAFITYRTERDFFRTVLHENKNDKIKLKDPPYPYLLIEEEIWDPIRKMPFYFFRYMNEEENKVLNTWTKQHPKATKQEAVTFLGEMPAAQRKQEGVSP